MWYQVGDYVYPSDLPRRVRCRVEAVERKALDGGETIQILTLAPLDGPWSPGTQLVRLDGSVVPARGETTVAHAAAAARQALDRGARFRGARVVRLALAPRRLAAAEPDDA